jgi:hypothetical protein
MFSKPDQYFHRRKVVILTHRPFYAFLVKEEHIKTLCIIASLWIVVRGKIICLLIFLYQCTAVAGQNFPSPWGMQADCTCMCTSSWTVFYIYIYANNMLFRWFNSLSFLFTTHSHMPSKPHLAVNVSESMPYVCYMHVWGRRGMHIGFCRG